MGRAKLRDKRDWSSLPGSPKNTLLAGCPWRCNPPVYRPGGLQRLLLPICHIPKLLLRSSEEGEPRSSPAWQEPPEKTFSRSRPADRTVYVMLIDIGEPAAQPPKKSIFSLTIPKALQHDAPPERTEWLP